MDDREVHWVIRGRVQGVGYRYFAVQAATDLGLRGTVRNHADGTVHLRAAGPPERVEALRDRLRRGPPAARVEAIEDAERDAADLPAGFRVRY